MKSLQYKYIIISGIFTYQLLELAALMSHPLDKYMLKRNLIKKDVELQLSDSSENKQKEPIDKNERSKKINQLFSNRKKTRIDNPNQTDIIKNKEALNDIIKPRMPKFQSFHQNNQEGLKQFPQIQRKLQQFTSKKIDYEKVKKNNELQGNQYCNKAEVPIYKFSEENRFKVSTMQLRSQAIEEQKKLLRLKKKQQKLQQEKKKLQQNKKRKTETFKRFLTNITQKNAEQTHKNLNYNETGQLHNIGFFNRIQQENIKQVLDKQQKVIENNKGNIGLIYKKLVVQKQKIPIAFLKLLLSYKYSNQVPTQQTKKVPNFFQDQFTYKKVFHYLVINQCIADIHLRIQKITEGQSSPISITITNFKKNSDGFTQFNISEFAKDPIKQAINQKQKYMLKNLSLSRNRLGLITNSKNFQFNYFGIPCLKNQRIFSFLCLLVTPQSKQQLNSQIRGLCNIEIDNLNLIMKTNKTSRAYFYDLQKITTQIREYLAVSHLYYTEVAQFIYNPLLIEKKHLEMIPEDERESMQPILNKLKSKYNNTQFESIREMAFRESGIVLLQGPPGTGKTTTLMGLLAAEYEYLKHVCNYGDKKKILICAPSNAAINHITKRLVCEGLISTTSKDTLNFSLDGSNTDTYNNQQKVFPKILRVGIVETDDQDILSVSLDDICDKKMMEAKNTNKKRNNLTTTQIKQKMINLSKEINQIKNRKDLQEWQIQSQMNSLKFEIKKYESLLFNFRKQRIQLKQTYNQIESKLFQEADIILTTLNSSGSQKMERLRGFIGCLIVDEAAQTTQPGILIPFQTGVRKILLIGDPYQLPSTTMSQDSSVTLFNRSLFQRFIDNGVKPYFLNIQYRMAPMIRQFPSSTFYQNRLIDAQDVVKRYMKTDQQQRGIAEGLSMKKIGKISQYFGRNSIFIDIKFGQEQLNANSYRNLGQCLVVKRLLIDFIKQTQLSIGVITPYQSQRKFLLKQLKAQFEACKMLQQNCSKYCQQRNNESDDNNINNLTNQQNSGNILNKSEELQEGQYDKPSKKQNGNIQQLENSDQKRKSQSKKQINLHKIGSKKQKRKKELQEIVQNRVMINTVDSFQGQQKDIIIVSTVRSNQRKDIGFMKDERRINVALTRSRHLLIVVGNGDTIGSNETWNKYLDWIQNRKCYYQIQNRQSITQKLTKLSKEISNEKVNRIKYTKLSKDSRREQREQIKRQDFSFGKKGNKKIKKENEFKLEEHKKKELENNNSELISIMQEDPMKKIQKLEIELEDEKRNEVLMEQKRIRQQQARNLEEVNKRIRQLEQKMMQDGDNPYAKLFYDN